MISGTEDTAAVHLWDRTGLKNGRYFQKHIRALWCDMLKNLGQAWGWFILPGKLVDTFGYGFSGPGLRGDEPVAPAPNGCQKEGVTICQPILNHPPCLYK